MSASCSSARFSAAASPILSIRLLACVWLFCEISERLFAVFWLAARYDAIVPGLDFAAASSAPIKPAGFCAATSASCASFSQLLEVAEEAFTDAIVAMAWDRIRDPRIVAAGS